MKVGDRADVVVYLGSGDRSHGKVRRGVVIEVYKNHAVVQCRDGYKACINHVRQDEQRRIGKASSDAKKMMQNMGGE